MTLLVLINWLVIVMIIVIFTIDTNDNSNSISNNDNDSNSNAHISTLRLSVARPLPRKRKVWTHQKSSGLISAFGSGRFRNYTARFGSVRPLRFGFLFPPDIKKTQQCFCRCLEPKTLDLRPCNDLPPQGCFRRTSRTKPTQVLWCNTM